MGLTSLAAIKRACALGASLELVATSLDHLRQTMEQGPRPIARVQTNAIAIRGCHRNGGESYDPERDRSAARYRSDRRGMA